METPHQQQQQQQQQTKPPIISPSSSPSHEFSFTISLNSSSTTTITNNPLNPSSSSNCLPTKTPLTAIDLSPADEIFFHGHLLPLHFLSHRSSTHSLDSFTLPDDHHQKPINRTPEKVEENDENEDEDEDEDDDDDDHCISFNKDVMDQIQFNECRAEQKINNSNTYKSKSFSLFGLSKWKKNSSGLENKEKLENDDINNNKRRKVKFDVSQIVKRYIKMVKPLLTASRGGRREKEMIRGGGRSQSYSFSGTVTPKLNNYNNNYYYYNNNNNTNNNILRGRRGEYSAPASMRTSPTNSGVLLATPLNSVGVSDSTMDELHSAIQAAIAHCKNSISLPQQDLPSSLPAVV